MASPSCWSDSDLKAALTDAHVPQATADAVVKTNRDSRIAGLRAALSILALIALIAQLFTRGIPTVQPGTQTARAAPGDKAATSDPAVAT